MLILNCIIILEAAVCAAVELFCIIQRRVSVIKPTLIDINGMDKIIKTPVSLTQYNSTPQTTFSKNILKLNQHLFETEQKLNIITFTKGGFIAGLWFLWFMRGRGHFNASMERRNDQSNQKLLQCSYGQVSVVLTLWAFPSNKTLSSGQGRKEKRKKPWVGPETPGQTIGTKWWPVFSLLATYLHRKRHNKNKDNKAEQIKVKVRQEYYVHKCVKKLLYINIYKKHQWPTR